MKTVPVQTYRNGEESIILPNGKYSHESNLVSQICEANSLLDEGSQFIAGLMNLYEFGDEFQKLKKWQNKLKRYAEKQKIILTKGGDWTNE